LNKGRKGRFTEVVRDIFGKRPEIFVSRRAKKVSAPSFSEGTLSLSNNIPATIPGWMEISKSDRRMRVFPRTIRIIPSLNGTRAITIEPWITRRERFSWRRNEPTHTFNYNGTHLFGGYRGVSGVKAGFVPRVVRVEATQCPPIRPIEVPESAFRAGRSCRRDSVKIKSYKVVVRVTDRRKNGVVKTRGVSGET
jgi:hypothetical protein